MLSNRYISMLLSAGGASSITFLSYPLLATLYSMENFGYFGVVNAYALIAGTLVLLRFDYFMLSTNSFYLKRKYLLTAIYLSIALTVFSIVIGLGIVYFYENAMLLHISMLTGLLACYNVFIFYFIAVNKVKYINVAKVIRALSILIFQLISFYFFDTSNGLLIGLVFGMLVTCLYLFYFVFPDVYVFYKKLKRKKINLVRYFIKTIIGRLPDIKLQLPQTGLNSITNNGMPIVFEFLFGLKVAGAILLVEKIIKMPMGIIIETLRPMLIKDFSKMGYENSGTKLQKLLKISIPVSFLLFVCTYILGLLPISQYYPIWTEIKYLLLPVICMPISMMIAVPIFCRYQAANMSKNLFVMEIIRFMCISILVLTYTLVASTNEVIFYYLLSLCFGLAPLAYVVLSSNSKKPLVEHG